MRTPLRAEERDVVILELSSSQNTPGMEISHEKGDLCSCVPECSQARNAPVPAPTLGKRDGSHVIMTHTSTYG